MQFRAKIPSINAAIYDRNGDVIKIMRATPENLNLNIATAQEWREIDASIANPDQVPAMHTLPRHSEFRRRG